MNSCEIVDGIEIELLASSIEAPLVADRLGRTIAHFAGPKILGEVHREVLIELELRDRRQRARCPKLAYVSYRKWPQNRPIILKGGSWEVVPDICIEVISPQDEVNPTELIIVEYFEAGVLQVWIVLPFVETVKVYESRFRNRLLGTDDTLTGGDVLPGFELALGKLFRTAGEKA